MPRPARSPGGSLHREQGGVPFVTVSMVMAHVTVFLEFLAQQALGLAAPRQSVKEGEGPCAPGATAWS